MSAIDYRRLLPTLFLALLLLTISETQISYHPSHDFDRKMAAVNKALQARNIIGDRLVGPEYTEITTTLGPLYAKQLSLHPDFAAVGVELLSKAGVKSGDMVAVNFSGSFPALNIAVLAAVDAIGAVPVITSSVGASTWGATDPELTWLDMEQLLVRSSVWEWKTAAASIGGVGDRGGGLSPEGIALARQAIARSGALAMVSDKLENAISRRLEVYQSDGVLPATLVNVGGSHVAFGRSGHKYPLREGISMGYQPHLAMNEGLGRAFIDANRPVIHVLNVGQMAARYGIKPGSPPGASSVFFERSIPLMLRIFVIVWIVSIIAALRYGYERRWWQGPCR